MGVRTIEVEAVLTGADASATGSGKSIRIAEGEIEAVYIDVLDQPDTIDLTITCGIGVIPVDVTVLSLTDVADSDFYYPVAQAQKTDGTNVTGWYDEFTVNGYVRINVTGGGNAGPIKAYVVVSC